jgi:hypothetical protein
MLAQENQQGSDDILVDEAGCQACDDRCQGEDCMFPGLTVLVCVLQTRHSCRMPGGPGAIFARVDAVHLPLQH